MSNNFRTAQAFTISERSINETDGLGEIYRQNCDLIPSPSDAREFLKRVEGMCPPHFDQQEETYEDSKNRLKKRTRN